MYYVNIAPENPLLYNAFMAKEPQLYEIGLLIQPELPEGEASAVLGTIRSYIEKTGGVLESTVDPKLRKLAYPIKKLNQAYFAALQFTVSPDKVTNIKKDVETNTSVIRHLILTWKKEVPRPVLRRPLVEPSPDGSAPAPSLHTPPAREDEPKTDIREIDKKLDEILGD